MKKILLFLLIMIFSLLIISASDLEGYFFCGGDEQASFLCFGDEQLNFWGVITLEVKEILTFGFPDVDIFIYPNYLYLIFGILVFLLVILLLILFVRRKKQKKRFKNE